MNAIAEAERPSCCPTCILVARQCARCSLRADREVARAARRAILLARSALAELRR